jgi:hypothetical protein
MSDSRGDQVNSQLPRKPMTDRQQLESEGIDFIPQMFD